LKTNQRVKLVLASLDLGLAEDFVDFLGNVISEDIEDEVTLIFRTQEDARVDDKICQPLDSEEWKLDDPFRPSIPDDTHPNCRCFWEDKETGEIIGQDGIFANPKFGSAEVHEGKKGSWKTINGTPVFFPDGEDGKDVIDKAFKDKPKSRNEQIEDRLKSLEEKDTTVEKPETKNKMPDKVQKTHDKSRENIEKANKNNQKQLGIIREETDRIENKFGKDSPEAHDARLLEMKSVIKVEGATSSHNNALENMDWRENEATMLKSKSGTAMFVDNPERQTFMIDHIDNDLTNNTNPLAQDGLVAIDLHEGKGKTIVHKFFDENDKLMVSTGTVGGTYLQENNSIQLYNVNDSLDSNINSIGNYSHEKGHLLHDTSLEWDSSNLTTSDTNSEKFWQKSAISSFETRITNVSDIDTGLRVEISPYHESFRGREAFNTEGFAEISRLRQTDVPAYDKLKESNPSIVEMHRQIADGDFRKWFVSKGEITVDFDTVLT
jgi:hypothetical protein